MTKPKGSRQSGVRECTTCSHPSRAEIDAMILSGTNYNEIIDRMRTMHPGREPLTKSALTRHKTNHLLNQPITVTDENGEKTTYLTGVIRSESLVIPREAIPTPGQISLQEALDIIIIAGSLNVLNNPAMVGMKALMEALALKEKMGDNTGDKEEWEKAWASREVQERKKKLSEAVRSKTRVTRAVTMSETREVEVEEPEPQGEIVDVEAIEPATGVTRPLPQLPEGVIDGTDEFDFASIPRTAIAGRTRSELGADLQRDASSGPLSIRGESTGGGDN